LSDVSIALDLAMMTKLFKDGPAIFERHIRRGILSLYELYNGKGSYYMWQLVGSIVDQFRRFEVLGLYTQGTMEQCASSWWQMAPSTPTTVPRSVG
jgi:hypothetical protein